MEAAFAIPLHPVPSGTEHASRSGNLKVLKWAEGRERGTEGGTEGGREGGREGGEGEREGGTEVEAIKSSGRLRSGLPAYPYVEQQPSASMESENDLAS